MERNLRANEALLREITDNISDMIAKIDVDGTIKYITPNKNDILGYGFENVIGENLFDFVHKDDKENVRRDIQKLINTNVNQKLGEIVSIFPGSSEIFNELKKINEKINVMHKYLFFLSWSKYFNPKSVEPPSTAADMNIGGETSV